MSRLIRLASIALMLSATFAVSTTNQRLVQLIEQAARQNNCELDGTRFTEHSQRQVNCTEIHLLVGEQHQLFKSRSGEEHGTSNSNQILYFCSIIGVVVLLVCGLWSIWLHQKSDDTDNGYQMPSIGVDDTTFNLKQRAECSPCRDSFDGENKTRRVHSQSGTPDQFQIALWGGLAADWWTCNKTPFPYWGHVRRIISASKPVSYLPVEEE
jgi:hypothetical protein